MAEVIKTADEFQTKVLEAKTPVLVDFLRHLVRPVPYGGAGHRRDRDREGGAGDRLQGGHRSES